jgi:hypothetical protein
VNIALSLLANSNLKDDFRNGKVEFKPFGMELCFVTEDIEAAKYLSTESRSFTQNPNQKEYSLFS